MMVTEIEEQSTTRQKMIELLKSRPFDAGGLSRALGVKQREIERHLKNVAKTAQTLGFKWVIDPARCEGCGFKFTDRERTTKPSRCPKCRGEQILYATFFIEVPY